jgi:PAS domain S-box-containing protein
MVSPAPPRPTTRHRPAPRVTPRPDKTASPAPALVGRFRIDAGTAAWEWSPELFALLGLSPDSTRPGTEALLRCQHGEDRGRTLAAVDRAVRTGRPFALETRVLRHDGTMRIVVLTGEARSDGTGRVVAIEGMCADITEGRASGGDDVVTALETEIAQLRTAMASRATIEQAKGILMLLTGCTEQVAFELLAHMSSHTHRKVREVAESITESATGRTQLPDDLRAILRDACPPTPRSG